MGIAASTSVNKSVAKVSESFDEEVQNTCSATCSQIQSGDEIDLDNSTVGDITFTQTCTADASCAMDTAIDQLVTAVQSASQDSSASPSLFPGIQINTTVNTTEQQLSNSVKQTIYNLCDANINQVQTGQIIYAKNSTAGNISFQQNGNASANCIITNSLKATANITQSSQQKATSGSDWTSLIFIIIILSVLGGITMVVIKKMNDNKKDQTNSLQGGDVTTTSNNQLYKPLPATPVKAS